MLNIIIHHGMETRWYSPWVFHTIPWTTHGKLLVQSMGFPYNPYQVPCVTHGNWLVQSMSYPYNPMDNSWEVAGAVHGFSMSFCPYEFTMVIPWNNDAMSFPWITDGNFIRAKTHGKLMEFFLKYFMGYFCKGKRSFKLGYSNLSISWASIVMPAVFFEVPWASRLLQHASLWLAMFEMHPSTGGVPDPGSDPAYGGMTFSLSHKRSRRNPVWNGSTTDKNEVE